MSQLLPWYPCTNTMRCLPVYVFVASDFARATLASPRRRLTPAKSTARDVDALDDDDEGEPLVVTTVDAGVEVAARAVCDPRLLLTVDAFAFGEGEGEGVEKKNEDSLLSNNPCTSLTIEDAA
jgi:hypothetical protein